MRYDGASGSRQEMGEEYEYRGPSLRHRLLGLVLLVTLSGTLGGGLLARLSTGLVHLVEEVQAGHLEVVGLLLDLSSGQGTLASLALGDELAESSDLLLDTVGLSLVQAVGELVQGLLSVVDNAVGAVGSLDGSLTLLVGLGILLGVLDHLLDLAVGQTRAGGNGDGLVLVGGLVLGVDVDNRVGVNVEGNLDLGNTTVGRRDANQLEVAKQLVVLDELTLTLVNLDLNSSLEVGGGREDLGLLGGNGGVAVDQTSEDTAEGLNTERQGSDVQEQEVLDLTREDSTLDGSTNGNSLIRVDRLGGVTAEDALDGLGNLGHTGHTTNEDNLLDVLGLEAGVLQGLLDRLDGPADKRVDHLLKLSAGELQVDVLGARGISSDEGQVDVGLQRGGQLDLGLLSSLTDTLDSHAVAGQVEPRGLLEVLDHVAHEVDVEILTAQVGITVGGLDLKDTVLDLQDGDIESTTAEIVDSDNTVGLLLETVGKGSSGRLVDDTENVQTGDLTGILGGLTLGVVEVGRDGNDGVLDGLAEVGLGSLLHLLEDESTDLGGGVALATGRHPGVAVGVLDDLVRDLLDVALNLNIGELSADQPLGGEEGVFGVNDGLTLGGDTDQTLAILGESDY
ncbi:hypothetical protein VSDG_02455 [Cytospora chrysosperma]|uniref:Uncharacterized protein n=1 Tax=Cytospora chrysosperma TaxID=252740 RepID=A0A423WFY4_CYTCH|nr:hypothetical protein VSDG_02455 [Valsa sordida]